MPTINLNLFANAIRRALRMQLDTVGKPEKWSIRPAGIGPVQAMAFPRKKLHRPPKILPIARQEQVAASFFRGENWCSAFRNLKERFAENRSVVACKGTKTYWSESWRPALVDVHLQPLHDAGATVSG